MVHLSLNSLSANGQHTTQDELQSSLAEVIGCLDTALYALIHGAAVLWFDAQIEDRPIMENGGTLRAVINRLERDFVKKWYLYTRNRATLVDGEASEIEVTSAASPDRIRGVVYEKPLQGNAYWVSFSGVSVFQTDQLLIRRVTSGEEVAVGNAARVDVFQLWWPRYESSPKHGRTGYRAASGEWVSPMPLDDAEAQKALDISEDVGGARIATYQGRQFRFMLTYPNRNVYHGFEPTASP